MALVPQTSGCGKKMGLIHQDFKAGYTSRRRCVLIAMPGDNAALLCSPGPLCTVSIAQPGPR